MTVGTPDLLRLTLSDRIVPDSVVTYRLPCGSTRRDTPVKTYTVHAKRWARGWELHIDGLGVTQSHSLADAELMARDYIETLTGAAPGSFNVEITR